MGEAGKQVAASGTFRCPQALIENTSIRDSNTVPKGWTMESITSYNIKAQDDLPEVLEDNGTENAPAPDVENLIEIEDSTTHEEILDIEDEATQE